MNHLLEYKHICFTHRDFDFLCKRDDFRKILSKVAMKDVMNNRLMAISNESKIWITKNIYCAMDDWDRELNLKDGVCLVSNDNVDDATEVSNWEKKSIWLN